MRLQQSPLQQSLRIAFVLAVCLAVVHRRPLQAQTPDDSVDSALTAQFVVEHCLDCHTGADAERGFELSDFGLGGSGEDSESAEIDVAAWEKVLLRIGSRQMPPPDYGQPDESEYAAVEHAMARILQRRASEHPYAGVTEPLRRLTRTEYKHSIRDLLSVELDVSEILPPDSSSDGFDNITVGELSPLLIDRYLTAATQISRAAIGSSVSAPGGITIRVPPDQSQERHVTGLPLGTRGGTLVQHHFPRDGVYEIQVRLTRDRDERIEGMNEPHELDVLVDRQREHRFELKPIRGNKGHSTYDADFNVRVTLTAGSHQIGVTFPEKSTSLLEIKREPFDASYNRHRHPRQTPAVHEVSIVGPFHSQDAPDDRRPGAADDEHSASRRAVFVARPNTNMTANEAAEQVFSNLLRKAYRRPIEPADLAVPMQFFQQSYSQLMPDQQARTLQARFEAGVEAGLTSILVNPNFLFRAIEQPADLPPGVAYPIHPVELAGRLSFFLWSSLPDEELLSLAESGQLTDPQVLDAQTRRMLADPRSQSLVDNFADQWLYLRNLPSITPDLRKFPSFDNNLREAFAQETKLLFADVIARDASVMELIDSKHAFLNDRLAMHYDIPGVVGSHFRQVELRPQWHRGGLLRQGSVLMATSYATRTSPTIRGAWVLENVLGTPPPPPPPNVPTIKEKSSAQPLSFRDALAQHRSDAACASCHDLIDPVGFALDRYDAVGRWRMTVEGEPVDASGRLPDGQEVVGVQELEQGILKRPALFVTALTEKLVTYAVGRPVTHDDGPAVRQIVTAAAQDHYRFSDLVSGITHSPPFLMRTSR
ncbi:DUF1592 domain-containing protein [Stieleria sp. TO1_6]|uniref:DUF1592 domain-containing protein n=1 Tax=Stieleria tagensis TaxID=2956795 RepID=UPI00209B4E75|nr:DUF1592 domain-containing protein [Stieleria tagensis]MCO8122972.1 DUF1592 domain-containing protein [Stieleria tagensis]